MVTNESALLADVAEYYSDKLAQHGETPQGVDWNGSESQELRFRQLSRLIRSAETFSVNDLGCGYGAYLDYLSSSYPSFSYSGIDVSEDMIAAASRSHEGNTAARFYVGSEPEQSADYGVASGIFNVRMDRTDQEWRSYIESTLEILDRTSKLGFTFNCLTSYSDAEKMREYLYYSNPCELFDYCKRHYAKNVALLHDYGLYEFTILVRKWI